MKNIFILIALCGIILFTSCEKEYEIQKTSTVELAGEWWVHHNVDGGDLFGAGYHKIYTYNTAADDGKEIWISDEGHFWDYRVKCPVNADALTFESDTLLSVIADYEIKVVVKNGKILKGAGKTLSGRDVDSIYYEVWFEDWPATIDAYGLPYPHDTPFQVGGVAHTGFGEDDPTN